MRVRASAAAEGALGALLGAGFFVAVYGYAIVDPARIDWLLHGDPAQHYLGFAFFRNAEWSWPLGAIADFGAPQGTSLVFTDAIPLLGIPLKLFSRWLPADFQYLGFWMLLCYALHGAFAQRVLGRLELRGAARIAAILLLLTSPALALRAYGHESLMAHWLLLASFEAHLAGRPGRQGPLLLLGAMIHAYWLALLAPFVALAWWRGEVSWRHRLGWLAAVAFAMAAAGYFIARPAQLAAIGYGQYSANLLTFVDPMDWRAFLAHFGRPAEGAAEWSQLLPAQGHAQADQYEGFAYLGAGALALLVVVAVLSAALGAKRKARAGAAARGRTAAASARETVVASARETAAAEPDGSIAALRKRLARAAAGPVPSLRPLWVLAIVMAGYALSTRVTFGSHVLADPALPPAVLGVLSVFRATGRFVWPLALLLPLWGCAHLVARIPARTLAALLAAALALQAWDLSAKWGEFGRRFAPGALGALPDYAAPAWAAAAHARHLVVVPAAADQDWITPALYAARHRQSVNVGLLSRPDEGAARKAEAQAIAELSDARPRPDTAYWVRDPALLARLPEALSAVTRRLPLGEGAMIVPR